MGNISDDPPPDFANAENLSPTLRVAYSVWWCSQELARMERERLERLWRQKDEESADE